MDIEYHLSGTTHVQTREHACSSLGPSTEVAIPYSDGRGPIQLPSDTCCVPQGLKGRGPQLPQPGSFPLWTGLFKFIWIVICLSILSLSLQLDSLSSGSLLSICYTLSCSCSGLCSSVLVYYVITIARSTSIFGILAISP